MALFREFRCAACGVRDDFAISGHAASFDPTALRIHGDLDSTTSCRGELRYLAGMPATVGVTFSNEEATNKHLGLKPGDPRWVKGGTVDRTMEQMNLGAAPQGAAEQVVESAKEKLEAARIAQQESRRNDGDPAPLQALAKAETRERIEREIDKRAANNPMLAARKAAVADVIANRTDLAGSGESAPKRYSDATALTGPGDRLKGFTEPSPAQKAWLDKVAQESQKQASNDLGQWMEGKAP